MKTVGRDGAGLLRTPSVTHEIGLLRPAVGEVAALKVRDVDLGRRRITVAAAVTEVQGHLGWGSPKTNQRRTVPIPAFVAPIIASAVDGKAPDDIAFTSPGGGVLRYRAARLSWFETAVKISGCPDGFHPHELRHAAASLAISDGSNVKVASSGCSGTPPQL